MSERPLRGLRGTVPEGAGGTGFARVLPSGVVTFLFTDVEGSTRLLRAVGSAYAELLAAHNEMIRRAVDAHGGTEVRTEGDAFFCVFTSAADAIAAALEAQRALCAHRWPAGAEVSVRMGLHTGDVEPGSDDYIGLAVHRAARVVDAGHGKQILVSDATALVAAERLPPGASLRALGAYRLKDFPAPSELHQLCHPELPSEFPALRTLPAAAHNVPAQTTRFVNRRSEVGELEALIADNRLVSILGPGGVGKTRLAAELVLGVVSQFPDGVWLVELASLRSGDAVGPEVATTLGVRAEAQRSADETLADALIAKRLLLVLDNCEHVLGAVASLADRLLRHCPDVHVLATSRQPLGLRAEIRFQLLPLGVPASPADVERDGSDAVTLFADRAQAVTRSFDLARDRDAVIEICRRLDGLPLAIELAAARTASIPVGRIAARLDRRFSVVGRSYRGSLPHHETLRGSIEWSHDLLEEPEKVLLRRLAVFAGSFDLLAAEAICGDAQLDEDDVLDVLARLVEKSLVQQSDERYFLLESIREFSREQLQSAAEVEGLAGAHLRYYTSIVESAGHEADGPGQRAAYDRLDADIANIRVAIGRALARSDPSALRMAAALGQYGFVRNRLGEVARWCIDAAAAEPNAPADLRARALTQAGFALIVMGSPDRGHSLLDEGVSLARASGDASLLMQTLLMAADLRLETGEPTEAQPLAREALALVPTEGADWMRARVLAVAARADQDDVGYTETHRRLAEALGLFERVGDRRQMGRVLHTMAYLSLDAGELDIANAEAARCIAIGAELEHPIGQAVTRIVQVWAAIDRGELDRANELLAQSTATAADSGYRALLAYCAAARAGLLVAEARDEDAARVLGTLEQAATALGGEGSRPIRRRVDELRDLLRQRLGDTRFAALAAHGSEVSLEDAAAPPLTA